MGIDQSKEQVVKRLQHNEESNSHVLADGVSTILLGWSWDGGNVYQNYQI